MVDAGSGLALGTGLVSRLVSHAFSRLSGRLKRLSAVQEAFERDFDLTAGPARTALNDLRQVVGSRTGGYSEEMETLFQTLTSSGLLYRMAEAAIAFPPQFNRDTGRFEFGTAMAGLQGVFVHIFGQHFLSGYATVGKEQISGKDLFRKLMTALRASIWSQSTNGVAAFKADAERKAVANEIRSLDRKLESEFVPPSGDKKKSSYIASRLLNLSSAREVASEIARYLIPAFEKTQLHGPRQRTQTGVSLDDVYVPLPVITLSRTGVQRAFAVNEADHPRDANEFQRSFFRATLLGDPGGGKSTLAQRLCLDLSRSCKDGKGPLPVQVIIRDYEAALKKDPQLALLTFATRNLARVSNFTEERRLERALRSLLNLGIACLIFDGLDEISDVADRQRFVNEVDRFASQFPLCPVLVTSRRVGYDRATLSDSFDHFELGPLTREQSKAYFTKVSVIEFAVEPDKAKSDAESFMAKTGTSAPDLVRNPLLLALMCWLYHERQGDMPENRALIYKECSLLMFKRWDEIRRVEADMPDDHDLMRLVTSLAGKIFRDQELQAGVTRQWLLDEAKSYFWDQIELDKEIRSRKQSEKFVEFITGRAWVLTERGNDVFTFTHRTFLEYFFARSLGDECETVDQLLEELTPRILNGQWNVPSHLAIQEKIYQSERRTEAVAQVLSRIFDSASNERDIESLLQFMEEALDYIVTKERLLRSLTRKYCDKAISSADELRYVSSLVRTSNDKPSIMFHAFWESLFEKLTPATGEACGPIIDWVIALRECWQTRSVAIQEGRYALAPVFFEQLNSVLEDAHLAPVNTDAGLTKIMFDLSRKSPPDESAFGPRLWESSVARFNRGHWILFDLSSMLESLSRVGTRDASQIDIQNVQFARLTAPEMLRQATTLLPKGKWYVCPRKSFEFSYVADKVTRLESGLALVGLILCLAYLELAQLFRYSNYEVALSKAVYKRFCERGHQPSGDLIRQIEDAVNRTVPIFVLGSSSAGLPRQVSMELIVDHTVLPTA